MNNKKYIRHIGENSNIPDGDRIRVSKLEAGNYVNINKDVDIVCPDLKLGNNVYIGKGSKINCRSLEIGDDTFIQGDVWIEGALNNLETKVKIGKQNLICQGTRINCNSPVKIGNHVGIGQNVRIWTHGYFMDILKGYPYTTGEVEIGNDVWLIEGSVVLPNTKIGNDVIIGTNSLVNKNIPSGSFAAGSPIKILQENIYPKKISYEEKSSIIDRVILDYGPIMESKGFMKNIKKDGMKIYFDESGKNPVMFDCEVRSIEGKLDKYGEDFRDYLRKSSIKFFNGTPFKSIIPLDFRDLLGEKN